MNERKKERMEEIKEKKSGLKKKNPKNEKPQPVKIFNWTVSKAFNMTFTVRLLR